MPFDSSLTSTEASKAGRIGQRSDASAGAETDSLNAKIYRELDLVSGAGAGFVSEAKRAVNSPGETSLKIAGAAAVGFGLAVISHKPGMIGLAAKSFAMAGSVSFAGEVLSHGGQVASAARSSWNSDLFQSENRKVVGTAAGAFLFDTALLGVAGSAGAVGSRSYFLHQASAKVDIPLVGLGEQAAMESKITLPRHSDVARLYASLSGKVGRVETLALNGDGLSGKFGTAFAIGKEGQMVTNHHVIEDALELTVFDRFGRAHKADVVKSSDFEDLALLQLQNPKAAAHFDTVPISGSAVIKQNIGGEPLYTVGFPNGWQKPFLSPGETINASRVDPLNMRISMHAENGNSGGPILDARGGLVGVLKQGDRSNHDITVITPAERVIALLNSAESADQAQTLSLLSPRLASPQVLTKQHYEIADGEAAAKNIEKIFPLEKRLDHNSEFFHSKITRVLMPGQGNIQELMLRSQYQPHSRSIVVEPLALDGKALANDMLWPGSNIPIKSSKLTLSLDRHQTPTSMEAINDPKMFLRRAFDHKSSGNYLAGLEPAGGGTAFGAQMRKSVSHLIGWLDAHHHH